LFPHYSGYLKTLLVDLYGILSCPNFFNGGGAVLGPQRGRESG
jgi:hypothetical protein